MYLMGAALDGYKEEILSGDPTLDFVIKSSTLKTVSASVHVSMFHDVDMLTGCHGKY